MKLIEDYKLKILIETDLIYNELIASGVDNWDGYSEVKFPAIEEIEEDFNNFANIETLPIKDGDTIHITVDIDKWDINEAYEIQKMAAKIFPNNNIVTTFKGIDIKVEKDEDRI